MKQYGEKEWAEMSEKERQMKMIGLRLEHRRLQQEEKHDEATALIKQLLGDQKGCYMLEGTYVYSLKIITVTMRK